MRYLVGILVFVVSITIWNLYPTKTVHKLNLTCQRVDQLHQLIRAKHVSAIDESGKKSQQLYNEAFIVLLFELDPLRVVFKQSEIDYLKRRNWVEKVFQVAADKNCSSFYKIIGQYNGSILRLKKHFQSIPDAEYLEIINGKDFDVFMQKISASDQWAKNASEYRNNIKWAVLTGYQEARRYADSDNEGLIVAKRMFKRQILDKQIKSEARAEEEIIRSLVHVLDAHSQYFTNQEMRDVIQTLTSSFVGVGIVVAEVKDGYKVIELIKNGPADVQKKLKLNDVITHVNGINIAGASRGLLSDLLSGVPESNVNVALLRKQNSKSILKKLVLQRNYVKTKVTEMENRLVDIEAIN